MSRPKNHDNVYVIKDAVTGEMVHTNPKQFRELMARHKLTHYELMHSYVGQAGRNKLVADKETIESAIEKYGIHENMANNLKALRPAGVKPRSHKTENIAVEIPATDVTNDTDSHDEPEQNSNKEESAVLIEDEEMINA